MGNTSASSKRHDRPYSIDGYNSLDRRAESPRGDERFDFSSQNTVSSTGSVRRRPVLCYQSSTDYGNDDHLGDFNSHANSSSHGINAINDQMLPTVFKWDGGGKDVYIVGTFSDWKPMKMVQSHGDFVTVADIPEGVHKYKFMVDGVEKVDKSSPLDEKEANNVLNVKKSDFEVFEALAMDLASNNNNNNNANNSSTTTEMSGSPPGSYTQEIPAYDNVTSQMPNTGPPILPPHLLQVILNNPSVNFCQPTLLPQPNHVMLNHLYALSIKDGVMVLSAIHRYRKKYVTTLLYKPI